ncbi:gliding motility-associated C-terminal domain-containing protein [Aureispira anguillae]|uniref:Gliding motility-associated C-terminal domain-containing protein n=1 Tax=Aureispira anguillae TaxID=2864201 RepID=A0A915YIG7_9BACT|nr:gliding motility-associated C-terminal domain-containing protein [Aureispira anguillae]BDS13802.1 gliding motility-associated C-terminal domain-containing protein [Aureispira anguillae]
MKKKFTLSHCCKFFAIVLMILGYHSLEAQTTNSQRTTSKCYSGPTLSFSNTSGTLLPAVNFPVGTGAGQIPANHRVVDVIVEIVWSKTDDGSCTSITGGLADLSHVGFQIAGPVGGARYLAASAATAAFPTVPTTNTFTGTFPGGTPGIVQDTIVFRDGYSSTLPVSPTGLDTIAPNNDSLNFYCNMAPHGNWSVGAIDDLPGAGSPSLCIQSYCITLITCDPTSLSATCEAFPTVTLDAAGVHVFEFADLDSLSDVSCITKSITFAPATATCANLAAPLPVTMTIRDHLNNVSSCMSTVTVVDNTPPVIPYCSQPFGTIYGNHYLNTAGVDTFFANTMFMTDNCGPITKQVRNITPGSPWQSYIEFDCVTGFQQFFVKGEDGNGNADSCRVIVQVFDTIAPTAVCGQDTAYVGNGPFTMPAINLDNGSFDVCPPIAGRWVDVHTGPDPVYTCADIGSDTVMLIVSDNSGNLDTCHNAVVIVLDTTAPTAICQNVTVYLNATGTGTLLASEVDNNSVDICSVDSLDINGVASVSYNCSHIGTTQNVTLHVFDASGNVDSCVSTVTVLDTFPPTAICRNFTIYVDGTGAATLQADSLNNNSVDVCTGNNLNFLINGSSTANFDCTNTLSNPNTVTLTVQDSYGNGSTCAANVTVLDTIDPVANCASPTVYLNNAGLATVTSTQLSMGSSDNCSVVDSFVNVVGISSANFTCSAIFTPQPTTLIIQDAAGNTGSCNTTVTVVDTVNPTALCEASYTTTLNALGLATVTPSNIDSASTDNCGLVEYLINGSSVQTYTCADVGSLGAVLTVRDSSGNIATCPTTINVVDNSPPTASCQITNVYLGASGTVAITPNTVLAFPATNDNCGTITTTFQGGGSNIIYNCDSIGPRTVNVVVTDASSNTSTCQTTVTVLDTISPTASCRPVPYPVQLDASGNGFVVPLNVNNGSSDICGVDTMLVNGVDSFFYTCASLGNTAVTLSVLDQSGNQSTCIANVVVEDNLDPTALCHDTTLYLNAAGVVTVFPADIDAGSSDNCTFTRRINNLPSVTYNCNQVGVNTAQLLIIDGAGNLAQCSANITVLDTITPVANCIGPNVRTVYLDNTCFASVPASTFDNGSTDNCSGSLTFRVGGLPNATFTSANLATNPNPLVLTVCDGSNNCSTCNTTVIVRDSTPPSMVCRPDTVQLDGTGNAIVVPNNINGGSSDNCNVPTYTINGGPFVNMTCADLGSNNVTLVGMDQSGNSDSCTTTVFVEDVTAPNASCNGMVTLILDAFTSTGTLLTTDVDNGSTDNCNIVNYTLSRSVFSCGDIPNNTHTVTMVVTDQSGNRDSCTTLVTVADTVAPVANCITTPLDLYLVGSTVSTTAAAINNGSTDNCAIDNISLSQSTFNCTNIGTNVVTLTVTDSSNNSGFCNAIVNVSDTLSPTPFCSNPTVTLDANGNVRVAATDLAPGSFDNCSIDTMLVNGQDSITLTCANLGTPVIATVFMRDPSGNTANCSSTITVVDNVNPTANCIGTVVQLVLDTAGIAVLSPVDINAGSTDNCTITSMVLSQDTFNCSNIGNNPNNVTLTVTDQSNNSDNCIAQVNITDTIRPVMACQPVTVNIHLSAGGVAPVSASMFDAGTADACGIANLSFTGAPNLVTCAHVGTHPITLIATDANGNMDSCITTLTVLDTVSPTITCNNITVDLNGFGNATIDSSNTSLYTVVDACGVSTLTLNGSNVVNYTCADVGLDTVVLTATDVSGNTASCNAVITVRDVTPPSVTCAITTQYLDTNGVLAVDPTWITANIIEACGVDTAYTSPDTLTCANVGPFNTVTLTVVDINGNSSSCNGNIEVVDTVPPTMVCRDTTVCVSGGFVNVIAADVDGGTTDACGLSAIQTINGTNNIIYTCADLGVQTVTLLRQDINGNSATCTANVTVRDCTAPTAVCKTNYVAQVGANGFATVHAIDLDFGSTDDCNIDSTTFRIDGQDSLTYSCNFIGTPMTVMFTVSDFSGNTDTCISTITIQDTVSPIARCGSSINAVLSASTGQFVVPAFNLNSTINTSTDNCGIATFLINGQAQATYDCSMLGANTAVLRVVDQSGNFDTCHATVNVQDITPPTATCQFTTNLTLDSTGSVSLLANNLIVSSSDNCGISSIQGNGQDTLIFTCDSIGNNQISVVVTDSSGNTFTCNAIVNVTDNINPTAICPTNPVPAYLNDNSIVWVTAAAIDSASFDNCQIIDYQINGTDSVLYNCGQIGSYPSATLTVIDSSNNSSTCIVDIDVLDTIPPVAQCSSITVTLSPAGIAYVGASDIDSLSSDNCGIREYLINNQLQDTFDCSNVGITNTVVLTVIDQYNNASFCATNVTVEDRTPPSIQCPLAAVDFYLGANGVVNVDPRDVATANDVCSILYWYINGAPDSTFDCSHVGIAQLVTIRVEDPSGNFAQCNAILNIRDTIPPTAFCQNLTVALDSAGSVTVTGADIGAFNTDNCAIVDTLINGQNSIVYTCDSIPASGDSIVAVLTVTDAAGNQNTCQSTITLLDNIAPTVNCHDTVVAQLDPFGIAIVPAIHLVDNISDNCTVDSFLINGLASDTFDCSDVGANNTVVLTVLDASNNQSNCTSVMQVVDNEPPTVICRDIDVYLNSNGNASIIADSVDGGSSDNCTYIASRTFSGGATSMSFNCSDTGSINVTLIVTDIYNNTDSCTAVVTVKDTTKPTVTCNNVIVDLRQNGSVVLTIDTGLYSVGTVFDHCGIDTAWVTPDTITCTDRGDIVFTLTARDHSGNIGTCQDTASVFLEYPSILIPSQDTTLCEGDTLPLSAFVDPNGINYDYAWSKGSGIQITQDPTVKDTMIANVGIADEGYYIFTIIPPSGGCPASDSIYLDINEVQPPVLIGTAPCDGDTAIIHLSNSSTYVGSTITYDWYFNGNLIANNTDSLIIPNMSAADSGSYSMAIQVEQGASICSDSSTAGFNFDVLDLPIAPIPTANIPCEGQSLTLFNNSAGYTYNWNGPAGFSTTTADPVRLNATQAFAGLYSLTITDANNCSNDGTVNVTISPTPAQPSLFYTQPLCVGDLLELQDTSIYTSPPVLYYWETPTGTIDTTTIGQLVLSNASVGEYMLTVSMNGCLSVVGDTANVVYKTIPTGGDDFFTIEFRDSLTSATAGGNKIINNDNPNPDGHLLTIVDSTDGGTIRLDEVNGTINYYPRSGFFGVDTLHYSLCDAQCPNSCDTIEVLIEVTTDFECFVPQGISPNGDGVNDEMIVRCRNNYPNALMQIFSRWGTLVYEGAPSGWNGQFNGKDLPDGTYFYILKLNDTTHTGTGTNKSEGRVGDQYSGYIMLQR